MKQSLGSRDKLWVMDAIDDHSPTEGKRPADWTGTICGALTAPVFFLFVYLGKAETGFTVSIVLSVALIAIRLRWNLRRHAWFWATIALIVAVQIPLSFIVRWPQTNIPTIAFSMPLGMAEFLLISGAISLADRLFSKDDSSTAEAE